MKGRFLALLALLAFAGCSDGQPPETDDLARSQIAAEGHVLTAVVTGFGGSGVRRGLVDVHLRSGELSGVIMGVLPQQLNCKVGDRVPVRQSGMMIVALPGVCMKGASL